MNLYPVTTATAHWHVGTTFEAVEIIGDAGKRWPALAVKAVCGNRQVRVVTIEPELWRDCPLGKGRCHLILDGKGSIVARGVHLVDALGKVKPWP